MEKSMNDNKPKSMASLLQILQDSLIQKLDILTVVEKKSMEQAELLADPNVSMDVLDKNMDEKAELIEKIEKLDSGFEALYESIRKELIENKDSYKEQIWVIQQYVSEIMDRSVSIEAIESRNKVAVEMLLRNRKKSLQHKRTASSVARNYQKTAKNLNAVNPQFIDNKK